jgi:hypothetical protein
MNKTDMINHPPHYTKGGIETLDYIKAKLSAEEYRGYLKGNILKYISRAGLKGEADADYKKVEFYAQELVSAHTTDEAARPQMSQDLVDIVYSKEPF